MRQGQGGGFERLAAAGEVVEDHPKGQQEAESGEGGEKLGGAGSRRGGGRGRNKLNCGSYAPILTVTAPAVQAAWD
ncbi:MAG: hypothetical protein ABSF25_00730 [Bryobacteraceae bacterium]|jgi:hypothetical protein